MAISTEKAFDMLPIVTVMYDKLKIDEFIKALTKENKNKIVTNTALGINLFKYILTNSKKVKQEVFEIVSVMEEATVEEIKEQSFAKTINTLKEVFTDNEATEFFKSAIK